MWGNTLGWLISAFLSVIIVGAFAFLLHFSSVSSPTEFGRDPANLAAVELPKSPRDAWDFFTDDSDAAPAYLQVSDAWGVDAERALKAYQRKPTGTPPAVLNSLVDARHCKTMRLFSRDLPSIVNYDSEHPKLENLVHAGDASYVVGLLLHLNHKPDEARRYFEAAFGLGRHLYEERVRLDEYQQGVKLMAEASGGMEKVETKGSELYDKLVDFDRARQEYDKTRIDSMARVITSVDQRVLEEHAGDIFFFAKNAKESMWRVESTLKLGRYRFDAGTFGDQIGASRAIKALEIDPDPAVAIAAAQAHNLTIEKYRTIH